VSKKCINKIVLVFIRIAVLFSLISYGSASQAKHILVFGDSLSAAYGINIDQGWVSLLEDFLNNEYSNIEDSNITPEHSKHKQQNIQANYQISNASISGETTTGGLARLELTLNEIKPDLVLLELGANDGLQGFPLDKMAKNLNSLVDIIEQNGIQVAIIGVSLPASYGPRYIDQFRNTFKTLTDERQLPYIDLYREDFYLIPGYMQSDGLHPTELAQPTIRDAVFNFLLQANLI